MKLSKDIFGVVDGEVYPKIIPAGEECPDELLEAARFFDAIEKPADPPDEKKSKGAAPENK